MADEATALSYGDLAYGGTTTTEAPKGSTEVEEVSQTAEEGVEESAEEVSAESDEQTEDESANVEVSEELADNEVTVDGESRKVTRSELIKGYQLESVATKRTMEAAEIKKTAEAKIAHVDESIKVLGDIEGEINSLILADVNNIDWDALRESDVSEYLRMKDVAASKQKVLSDLVAKRNQLVKQKTDEEASALHKALGWSDSAKKQADVDQITGYMQENDITEQVTSHKLMRALLDAAKYQKLQKGKTVALKEVRKAPKTTKPQKSEKPEAPKSYADLMYKS